MCNAFGHPFGCPCGFIGQSRGGSGGKSKNRGMIIGRRSQLTYFYTEWQPDRMAPMRVMAIAYKMNLMFPAQCWYCDRNVFLFADKNGGFVIFDRPGGEWPIHDCHGYSHRVRGGCPEIGWAEKFEAPVPCDAPTEDVNELSEGEFLQGTVVRITKKPERYLDLSYWPATLFTGQVIYQLNLSKFAECGSLVSGKIHWAFERLPCLTKLKRHQPPELKQRTLESMSLAGS